MCRWFFIHGCKSSEVDTTIQIAVSLPSGRSTDISICDTSRILDLRDAAQKALGERFLRLSSSDGQLLDTERSLNEAGLRDGDSVGAVRQLPQIVATKRAFALFCCGGNRVVTWGDPGAGGDTNEVQDQLRKAQINVQQIQATCEAFAAVPADAAVITWGHLYNSPVQDQLRYVRQIQANMLAFAAVLANGAWGHEDYGGDSSAVQDQLRNVQQIQATVRAFAAILADGRVVTWGDPCNGGDSSAVQDQLRNVRHIQATESAFAAILVDGAVVTWGDPHNGGDSRAVKDQLKQVQRIQATKRAFAAILADGRVVT
ncbi:unnamed protein product [Effrenium voratum]|nr:unnamed protein product [Effrenium voratum]